MIESSIKDYKEEVKIQFEKLRTCLEKNDTCDYSSRIEEIKIMISRSNPSLMFYGIYNAGKSSVLNAIFGEEVASVNDIPETHSVTKHDWRNYTLVDTPGLNAPVEGDEEVTLAEKEIHRA